ncbi:Carboxymethylenebutenolidase homolog [Linum perenne]
MIAYFFQTQRKKYLLSNSMDLGYSLPSINICPFSLVISTLHRKMRAASTSPFPLFATTAADVLRPCLHHSRHFNVSQKSSPPRLLFPSKCNCWDGQRSITWIGTGRAISRSLVDTEDNVGNEEACELVNGVEISIGEDGDGDGDDTINAYLCTAIKNNNGTGIVLLSDIFGFEDSATRDFAYRVACNGYNVLVPDLYRGDPWSNDRPSNNLQAWIANQDPDRIAKDIATSAKWMSDEFLAAGISKKLGLIGFCYGGGRVVEVLSKDQGNCFGIGISFYGTRIDTSLVRKLNVPVLFISGDSDPLCSLSVLKEIESNIGDYSKSKVVIFEGRGHGFVHRPSSAEEDKDAEEAFVMLRSWLNDGLVLES